jgi:hypothetical protein
LPNWIAKLKFQTELLNCQIELPIWIAEMSNWIRFAKLKCRTELSNWNAKLNCQMELANGIG